MLNECVQVGKTRLTCIQCGQPFLTSHPLQKLCSDKCKRDRKTETQRQPHRQQARHDYYQKPQVKARRRLYYSDPAVAEARKQYQRDYRQNKTATTNAPDTPNTISK